jgi:hypothetical protein
MLVRRMSAVLCLSAALVGSVGAKVLAQQDVPTPADPICASFQKTDKQWCSIQRVTVKVPQGSTELGPGACISRSAGVVINGVDVGAELNRRCP